MKCKIFFCSGSVLDKSADEKLNEWLKDNNVSIISFQYQQTWNGHSIAILYRED